MVVVEFRCHNIYIRVNKVFLSGREYIVFTRVDIVFTYVFNVLIDVKVDIKE